MVELSRKYVSREYYIKLKCYPAQIFNQTKPDEEYSQSIPKFMYTSGDFLLTSLILKDWTFGNQFLMFLYMK